MSYTFDLKKNSFLIYGLGSTGNSIIKFFKKNKISNYFIWDDNNQLRKKFRINNSFNILKTINEVDYIILSPGISLKNSRYEKFLFKFKIVYRNKINRLSYRDVQLKLIDNNVAVDENYINLTIQDFNPESKKLIANEYVFFQTKKEINHIKDLIYQIENSEKVNELDIAILGSYISLFSLKKIRKKLINYKSDNTLFNDLVTVQVKEPLKATNTKSSYRSHIIWIISIHTSYTHGCLCNWNIMFFSKF